MLLGTGMFAALAVAAAVALAAFAVHFNSLARELGSAFEGLRATEDLEARLLTHHHAASLSLLMGEREHAEEHARTRPEFEDRMRRTLEEARAHLGGLRHGRSLDEVETSLKAYLRVHREVEETHDLSPRKAVSDLGEAFDEAFSAMESLVTGHLAHVNVVRQQALLSQAAGLAAAAIAIVLLLAMVVLTIVARAYGYRPFVELRKTMAAFGRGDYGARVEERGPMELREIAHTFNSMASALAHKREEQLYFLAGVAHDLRNPLGALGIAGRAVAPDRPMPGESRIRDLFALVARQVARLDRLAGDMVDAASLEAGRLELRCERCDLAALAREAADLFTATSPIHRIDLALPVETVPVVCDPGRIAQALNNLVSNAVKYSPQGGDVTIAVRREDAEAVLSVTDQGVGIAEGIRERLFEPFHRASPDRGASGGRGSGLWVTGRIVEQHGGRIELESAPGAGSTFRLWLPLALPEPALRGTGGAAVPGLAEHGAGI